MSFITLPSPTVIGLVIAFAAVLLYFKGRRRYLDDIRGPKSGSWLYGTSSIAEIASYERSLNRRASQVISWRSTARTMSASLISRGHKSTVALGASMTASE